jgi:ATP-binding cassette subfamily B protein
VSRTRELPLWPSEATTAALEQIAIRLGTIASPLNENGLALAADDLSITDAATRLGLDADPIAGWSDDPHDVIRRLVPGLLLLPTGTLAIVEVAPWSVRLLGPDRRIHRRTARTVGEAVTKPVRDALTGEVEDLLSALGPHDGRTRQALQRSRLRSHVLDGAWALRPGAGAPLRSAVRSRRLVRRASGFAFAALAGYALFVASWAVLGHAALTGTIDGAALVWWAALLALSAGLRVTATWLEGAVGISTGQVLRQRVLVGALQLDPDDIRRQGVGQLTGRVLESQVVEDAAVGGGLLAVLGAAELAVAVIVLTRGAAPRALPLLLAAWVLIAAWVGCHHLGAARRWTAGRLSLTDSIVERIVGHRTRIVQCPPSSWHDGESNALQSHEDATRRLDRRRLGLAAVVTRGWVLTSLVVLSISGGTQAGYAVAIGGVLLAFYALGRSATAFVQLADVVVAAGQMQPLLAAARPPARPSGAPHSTTVNGRAPAGLAGQGLCFRRPGRDRPVLADCDVELPRGTRMVVEGASGAGKSTLVSVLAGLLTPDAGSLELCGRSVEEIGERVWRRRVSLSPQFHENHLMLGSLAFNLLLGRGWPPTASDLEDAWAMCQRLGLGPVLERMPSGLEEMVGDCGWQLSEGERSLVYVARSLLQRPDVILLDESFGSLDPVTLATALPCVVHGSQTLVVIRQ